MNYYNEHDRNAAAWLRELIARKLIPEGIVDEKDIQEVRPSDLAGFTQCHFFAGIGGWSLALQLAGWPSDRPVWTGSCPCQPFSVAGQGKGVDDERHLWPVFAELIRQCRPPTVFGEQVASAAGRAWLAGVFADLEGMGYLRAGADLCAAGVGAPHIRQRLWWVADTSGSQQHGRSGEFEVEGRAAIEERFQSGSVCSTAGWLEHPTSARCDRPERDAEGDSRQQARVQVPGAGCEEGDPRRLGHANLQQDDSAESGQQIPGTGHHPPVGIRPAVQIIGEVCASGVVFPDGAGRLTGQPATTPAGHGCSTQQTGGTDGVADTKCFSDRSKAPATDNERSETYRSTDWISGRSGTLGGFWSDSIFIPCRDGKYRRVSTQPEIFPLADVVSYRVGKRGSIRPALLKGAGNAIVPEVAAQFIQAYLECPASPPAPHPRQSNP